MIAIVLGTRAEFLRCVPLLQRLQKETDYHLVHTGQNKIDDMLKDFAIRSNNMIELKTFEGVSTSLIKGFKQTPALYSEMKQILKILKPTYVVCHGDTLTAFTTALASKGHYPIAHIEAGFRSRSIFEPIPEEFFRMDVDRRSDVLYSPSKLATENLLRERVRGQIMTVGSTVPDVVNLAIKVIGSNTQKKGFVLCSAHRYENIFIKSRLKRIVKILGLPRLPIYWPVHKITLGQLRRFGLWNEIKRGKIHILPPQSYTEFIRLLSNCNYVITDGGSIEEESIILKKHCLLLRKRTERVEGLSTGLTFLTRLDLKVSEASINRIETDQPTRRYIRNPYIINGSATDQIASHLAASIRLSEPHQLRTQRILFS